MASFPRVICLTWTLCTCWPTSKNLKRRDMGQSMVHPKGKRATPAGSPMDPTLGPSTSGRYCDDRLWKMRWETAVSQLGLSASLCSGWKNGLTELQDCSYLVSTMVLNHQFCDVEYFEKHPNFPVEGSLENVGFAHDPEIQVVHCWTPAWLQYLQ